ncbi:MAG: spoIIE [Clostridia bacterium]|jgi:stage II sporulation protein E|nr:spoIIE [Clostridia bacterium]
MLINTKEERSETILQNFRMIKWGYVLICMIGFLLSRICVFEAFYTLGVCYIGAVFSDKELRKWNSLVALGGLVSIGVFDTNVLKYILIIVLIILIRAYMSMMKATFNMRNQTLVTSVAIMFINLIVIGINGFKLFDLFIGFLETTVGMGLVIILCYSTEVILKNRKTPLTQKETISMAFLIACILGGLIDFYIQVPLFESIYFRDVMTFIIIIAITYMGGMNTGITISLIISTVLVLIGYMPPHFVAIYTLATLIGTVFYILDRAGVIFATGVGLLLGFALFNDRVIDWQIAGAYLTAGVISLGLPKKYFGIADWFGYGQAEEDEKHLLRVQKIITEKLNQFSKAFYNLSSTFGKISDKQFFLDEKDINYVIEDTGEKMCQNCSMKEFCWKDYIGQTYQSAYKMLDLIEKKGQLKLGDIPEAFRKSCINAESFACTLGFKLDLLKQSFMWKNRFVESRELVRQQFEAVAESINKLCENIEHELYFNKEDEKLIKEALDAKGIKTKDIMVLENNGRKEEIHIYTPYDIKTADIKENIIKAIHGALDIRVEAEKTESNQEERYLYFKFKMSKAYGILAGAAAHAKGEISGDVYSFMEVEDGRYLLALADGMGSGKLALEESTATIELLENFMDSGFKNDLAVKIINSVLVLKSDIENFSTMDITLIDEYTGVAEFLKMGAATSFILRNGEVTTIQSSTLPVGILKDVDMEIYKKQLKDGDVIIMVTDGMLQGENDLLGKEDTFKHFILEAHSNNPSYMAEYLVRKSRDLLGHAENDDMTIIVARIWQRNG